MPCSPSPSCAHCALIAKLLCTVFIFSVCILEVGRRGAWAPRGLAQGCSVPSLGLANELSWCLEQRGWPWVRQAAVHIGHCSSASYKWSVPLNKVANVLHWVKMKGVDPIKSEGVKSIWRPKKELTFILLHRLLARKAFRLTDVIASNFLARLKIRCCNDIPILGFLITNRILKYIHPI